MECLLVAAVCTGGSERAGGALRKRWIVVLVAAVGEVVAEKGAVRCSKCWVNVGLVAMWRNGALSDCRGMTFQTRGVAISVRLARNEILGPPDG